MAKETAEHKKVRLAEEAESAAKTPDELTKKALAEAEDPEAPKKSKSKVKQERVKPALKDTSTVVINEGGRRRTMRMCDYQAEQAAAKKKKGQIDG